ncbi:histidyl-tRNA synthetase [Dokdonia sp. Hel_I_63]|uniref:histidine--tRNA ligase n=1 Tax=unclassified Dokdonia TaxID=2615033 RepID=UPI00020A7C7D|nr:MULTISPECIES: histidine--tRNA ligase [unclassified Dokdonia]AEE20478.1 histidyl-tRNA synthetase [Dokdonia sp. 4H-3-7-5]TVZ23266.1 histidyl-tRNA synthetase [Dokdonia sp. Hel_I_63]
MSTKPSIPKGTRDFSPEEVAKRSYIMNTIRTQFQRFGFQPIETPSFENSSTLMGKYGEEGDRLIFKILNSGDYLKSFNTSLIELIKKALFDFQKFLRNSEGDLQLENFEEYFTKVLPQIIKSSREIKLEEGKTNFTRLTNDLWYFIKSTIIKEDKLEILKNANNEVLTDLTLVIYGNYYFNLKETHLGGYISEKALRYDLTVPFARYVVQHQNDIVFPFKRFQMQPVWRADRPQKGRFREFYQCDADVVGSDSLWQEVEFVQLYDAVFSALKLEGVTIKMNNRKVLSGIAEVIGASDKLIDFTVALDKLDKIGEEGVTKEMLAKGITQEAIDKVAPLFTLSGTFGDQLATLKTLLADSETGMEGINELLFINDAIENLGLQTATLQLDVTLARGLNYYTGAIFEVSAPEGVKMGSIGGGGRYADLTGIFGLKDMSGVGISFGLDRIYLVIEELGLFPEETTEGVKVFFVNFGDQEAGYAMKAISKLRQSGISAELYPDAVTSNKQMKKQMTYANRRNIPFLVLAGKEEMEAKQYTLKNMVEGSQETVSIDELVAALK